MVDGRNTMRDRQRHAGAEGIVIREMTTDDIPAGMRLKDAVGWNQLPSDWALYLQASTHGCFVAVRNGRIVGTTTAIVHPGGYGWIGMVVVDPAFRRLGIATRLVTTALAHLAGCQCAKLDATSSGRGIYARLGFVDDGTVTRLASPAVAVPASAPAAVAALTAADLDAAARLDALAFGACRRGLLAALIALAPDCTWKLEEAGALQAFCLGRPGQNFSRIGPIAATTCAAAQQVTLAALHGLRGRRVVIDLPPGQDAFQAWLGELGFAPTVSFARMVRGDRIVGAPVKYFAIMGGEFG